MSANPPFSIAWFHSEQRRQHPQDRRRGVAQVRQRLGLSQNAFARTFGLDVTAIHAWEQGRRRPDRTARILLAVIAKEPAAVRRALCVRSAA